MGFRHIVLFRWNDTADDDARAVASAALAELPSHIPQIVEYRFGPDAGLADSNWDFAVVADFADQAGYEVYRDHPVHQAVIADHFRPIVGDRAAVQIHTT